MHRLRVRRSIVAVRSARVAECGARASSRYLRSSRMMLGGGGGVRMSCGLRPVGLLRSCGLARVRSCGFDGLTFGACPTVPGCAVFDCAVGPLRGVLPGSASGLPLGLAGDVEGLAADGSVVEGLAAGAPPAAPVPAPLALPAPPELLCANAIPPDSSSVVSAAAAVTFMAVSILNLAPLAGSNERTRHSFRAASRATWQKQNAKPPSRAGRGLRSSDPR
jgi:hypothetical protein